MNQLNVNLPELPYAVSEAMNRLRINIKFCGKNSTNGYFPVEFLSVAAESELFFLSLGS